MTHDIEREDFQKNRSEIVSRCIDRGINYVDACCREEILAYAKALQGRRDKMYFGYSWHIKESRFQEWRSRKKLKEGLDEGMREAGLDYVDLWRISLLVDSHQHAQAELDDVADALDWAKKTGRARFIGVSSHDRAHLKQRHRNLSRTNRSCADARIPRRPRWSPTRPGCGRRSRQHEIGWFGIKPFASNSIFQGDSSPDSPHAKAGQRDRTHGDPLHSLQSRDHGADDRPDHAAASRQRLSGRGRTPTAGLRRNRRGWITRWIAPGPICRPTINGSKTGNTCNW